jgi:hypothetical protein
MAFIIPTPKSLSDLPSPPLCLHNSETPASYCWQTSASLAGSIWLPKAIFDQVVRVCVSCQPAVLSLTKSKLSSTHPDLVCQIQRMGKVANTCQTTVSPMDKARRQHSGFEHNPGRHPQQVRTGAGKCSLAPTIDRAQAADKAPEAEWLTSPLLLAGNATRRPKRPTSSTPLH